MASKINRLYLMCFVSIVLLAIVLRVYKAYYTGVIYDEALTYFKFALDINSAVSNYSTTNNHLLNSVLIYLSVEAFGRFDTLLGVPAIRIPAVFFGIVYVISVALTIWHTLRNKTVKIIIMGLCLFNYYVFDLSILARGYAIALGAVFLELLLIILYPTLLKDKDKTMALVFSALNFTALGAMLTSLYTVVPLNLALLGVVYSTSARDAVAGKSRSAFMKAFEMGSAIVCVSCVTLGLLYKDVIMAVISISGKNKPINDTPLTILKSLITEGLFKWESHLSYLQDISPYIILPLTLILTGLFIVNVATKKALSVEASIVLLILAASFLLAYTAHKAAALSLGFARNHVFWLPMMFITAGIIMDGALGVFDYWRVNSSIFPKAVKYVLSLFVILSSIVLMAGTFASPRVVTTYDWRPQSVVGPLLRQLNKTDPSRRWRLGFSGRMEFNRYPYLYYNNEVYVIEDSNVKVYHISEKERSPGKLYEYEFFKKFDCVVVLAQ